VTVNNQIVIGTLMNICDDPNRVSIGANWRESDYIKRVPIIVTGNDFSTLYAPLIRDGRMEKFYWQPQREDVVNIVWQVGAAWQCWHWRHLAVQAVKLRGVTSNALQPAAAVCKQCLDAVRTADTCADTTTAADTTAAAAAAAADVQGGWPGQARH
jgi:hypothetical protein